MESAQKPTELVRNIARRVIFARTRFRLTPNYYSRFLRYKSLRTLSMLWPSHLCFVFFYDPALTHSCCDCPSSGGPWPAHGSPHRWRPTAAPAWCSDRWSTMDPASASRPANRIRWTGCRQVRPAHHQSTTIERKTGGERNREFSMRSKLTPTLAGGAWTGRNWAVDYVIKRTRATR